MNETPPLEQEPDRVPAAWLLRLAALALAASALGVVGAWLLLRTARPSAVLGPASALVTSRNGTPEQTPILGPPRGLALEARQRRRLGSYGWVNRDAGIAHIPIERAMDLRAEQPR